MGRRSDHTREELHELALAAAQDIVRTGGLRCLTARGVTREIGYTIGTFYNLFENLDDLILQLNASTLDRLYRAVTSEHVEPGPEAALRAYARRYITFTGKNQKLWGAVFEHRLPNGQDRPDWYETRVLRLLGLAEEALKPFFRPGEEAERLHNARVLWGSLYGICSLAQSGSLPPTESATGFVDTLISNYIDALKKRRRGAKQKTPRPSSASIGAT